MRSTAVLLAVLVTVGVTGCTAATAGPTSAPSHAHPSAAASSAAPQPAAPPSSATLTADGTFEQPILCRAAVDYETTQAAISTEKLASLHTVAELAATDAAADLTANRKHTWATDVQPILQPYLTVGQAQVDYFRAVAASKSIGAATALQWPDGTAAASRIYAAIGIGSDLSCPKP